MALDLFGFMMKRTTILHDSFYPLANRSLIFDLDNTIFDENIFLYKGYARIARYINSVYELDANEVHQFLWLSFLNGSRFGLFEKMLGHFGLKEMVPINDLLGVFRNLGDDKLPIFKYFRRFLGEDIEFYIITNGNKLQQKAKIVSLGLSGYPQFIDVIYAEGSISKPRCDSYYKLANKSLLNKPVYIGDSNIDEEFAGNCGIDFIKINFERDNSGYVIESSISFEMRASDSSFR